MAMTDTWTAADGEVLAVTHEPVGRPGGPGLWHHKGMQLPAYIQHIANDLISERGMDESRAIATAVSRCKAWCAGGGGVSADTRAKACAAVAEWEALKTRAHTEGAAGDVVAIVTNWEERVHPRDKSGKFTHAPGGDGKAPPGTVPQAQHEQVKAALARATAELAQAKAQGRLSAGQARDADEVHKRLHETQAQLEHELNAHSNAVDEADRKERVSKIKKIIARILALISAGLITYLTAKGVETGPLVEAAAAFGPIAAEFGIEKVIK